ncbi:binuclear zinc transcription factor [Gaeumannomyces tritici R3-111a-1]|uniref:Binuclear zinc transcription factor n=1 Tax=Gaeumannomyces tritici (strain R3-111a-1) TaxID=644352 RepID=J3P7I0_GAET3|nr:binuclear zinc transcription factor [Gaeumannomyces tritici R3-111a-1]EJT72611.1 binuclear zinc transcription factor [Gaeumannomyces tritici R3-111a-1]
MPWCDETWKKKKSTLGITRTHLLFRRRAKVKKRNLSELEGRQFLYFCICPFWSAHPLFQTRAMPGRNMKRPAGSMSHPHVNSASDSVPAPATTPALELLACVICRDKKLRCGREGGACARCAKAGIECVYPESRRKVTVRRNNAQALEARLAQVEGMLRDTAKSKRPAETRAKPDASGDNTRDIQQDEIPSQAFDDLADDGFFPQQPESDMGLGLDDFPGHGGPSGFGSDLAADDNMFDAQLMGQGMFESTPPFEMIEDLHNWYFFNQQDIVPMLHQARYLQAFHSAPHMRPPMCLQYALWAVAANGHPRYQSYCDVFYRRARQYLEADELRGVGEHFITVPHAQAWIFVATYEARSLMLARAAMSCARAVRLCNLMGLHRLDDPEYEMQMMPTILPAQSWLELEERRRTFWAAFCVNSHVSIYSGWPGIIDTTTISTDLPCPEDAYERGREEQKMGKLPSLFTDGKMTYSPLCSAVGVCHIFNLILAHVNRARAGDGGGDLEHGAFWRRHREIDNLLLGGFMSLPACRSRPCAGASNHPHHRRRPGHLDWQLGGPMHVRLNLHASVICLHMAAIDRAEAHGLAADSTSSQWAVVASRSRGPGFVEDDGGGDGPASGATTAAAAAAAATPSTVPSGSFAQQSLSPPNGDHVGGKRRRLDARQGRSPQTAPDLTTTTAALPHRGSPSGSGCGGLGNLGSGLDAYCILDDGGLGWTEADMDALVREFVQVNQDAGDAEVASNGGQPWGAFNF